VSNQNFNIVDSILTVKASGCEMDHINNDLLLPQGKSIAELIDDQKENQTEQPANQPAQ